MIFLLYMQMFVAIHKFFYIMLWFLRNGNKLFYRLLPLLIYLRIGIQVCVFSVWSGPRQERGSKCSWFLINNFLIIYIVFSEYVRGKCIRFIKVFLKNERSIWSINWCRTDWHKFSLHRVATGYYHHWNLTVQASI